MKAKLCIILLGAALVVALNGCGSEEAKTTPEQKKDFQGGPMPSGFMQQHQTALAPKGAMPPGTPPASGAK